MNQFSGNRVKGTLSGYLDTTLKIKNNGNKCVDIVSGSTRINLNPRESFDSGASFAELSFGLPFHFNGLFVENKGNADLTLNSNGISKEIKAGKKFGWWYEPSYNFSITAGDSFEIVVIG